MCALAIGLLSSAAFSLWQATWPVSDTSAALEWLLSYLPTSTDADSCTNGTCACGSQGRVSMAGSGFGLHTVNTSRSHCTGAGTGGLTVKAAEAVFDEKLAGMNQFDSFLDYNVRARESRAAPPSHRVTRFAASGSSAPSPVPRR